MLKFLRAIILPLLPFWSCPEKELPTSRPLWESICIALLCQISGKRLVNIFKNKLFNHVKEFTCMNICSHAVPFSLFHRFLLAFTYFNVLSHAFTCFSYFHDFTSTIVTLWLISLFFLHGGAFARGTSLGVHAVLRGILWCFSFWQSMRIQLSGLLEEKVIFVGAELIINHRTTSRN